METTKKIGAIKKAQVNKKQEAKKDKKELYGDSLILGAKINLSKIDKDVLFKGEKGIYLDVQIFVNEKEDEFGNSVKICYFDKNENRIYLGNGIIFENKNNDVTDEDLDEDGLPF